MGVTIPDKMLRSVSDILETLPRIQPKPLAAPAYQEPESVSNRPKFGLAVESMKRHMTDEGYQIFDGLKDNGYRLVGRDLLWNETNCENIVVENPSTVVIQDKREWMGLTADRSRDPSIRFTNLESLRNREDIFKVTILKDAQNDRELHREAAEEIGCHAWIVYYHPDIICRLNPYLRGRHILRTYHTVDSGLVPLFSPNRGGCLLSGALSRKHYPLRWALSRQLRHLPQTVLLNHPGYHRRGSATPEYLRTLSGFKVAICTSSIYGYALRKIIEATACGCIVITDLPTDEVLPYIDANLVRVPHNASIQEMASVISTLLETYDTEKQYWFSLLAKTHYDFQRVGKKLANDIEEMRRNYP